MPEDSEVRSDEVLQQRGKRSQESASIEAPGKVDPDTGEALVAKVEASPAPEKSTHEGGIRVTEGEPTKVAETTILNLSDYPLHEQLLKDGPEKFMREQLGFDDELMGELKWLENRIEEGAEKEGQE